MGTLSNANEKSVAKRTGQSSSGRVSRQADGSVAKRTGQERTIAAVQTTATAST